MSDNPTSLSEYMAQVRDVTPKEPGETDLEYSERLYAIAKPLHSQHMYDFQASLAEIRSSHPRYSNETVYQWQRRTLQMARRAEALAYGGPRSRQQAKDRAWERERERDRPTQRPLTVRAELEHPKQNKLNKMKERYQP